MDTETKLTLAEIDAELATLPETLDAATKTFQELETANDTSAKGLTEHSKARSKVEMLTARKATLEAARPAAELNTRRQAVADAQAELTKSARELKVAEDKACQVLTPLITGRYLKEAIANSTLVFPAYRAFARANGKYRTLSSVTARWAAENKLKLENWVQ